MQLIHMDDVFHGSPVNIGDRINFEGIGWCEIETIRKPSDTYPFGLIWMRCGAMTFPANPDEWGFAWQEELPL